MKNAGRFSAAAAIAVLFGLFVVTGLRGVDFGDHWDEAEWHIDPVQQMISTGVFLPHVVGRTQAALALGGLLREDVALERVAALELAGRGLAEPLGGGPIGLHLGHDPTPSVIFVTGASGGLRHAFRPARSGLCGPHRGPAPGVTLLVRSS